MAGAGLRGGGDEPEVGDLDLAGVADEYVLRLDVAVDEPEPVRLGEPGEHRLHDGQRRRHAQRSPSPQDVAQRAAVDELHHEEEHRPVDAHVVALVVHVDDRGVVDPRRGAGLTLETRPECRVGR